MASEKIIREWVERVVEKKYSDWTIGTTNDPASRKTQLGNPLTWLQWQVDSLETARNVIGYFVSKGMGGVEAQGDGNNTHVFICSA